MLWIQVSPVKSKSHAPELEVLNEAGSSRGNRSFVENMGDAGAKSVLKQALRFTTRLLQVSSSGRRKIVLVISTLPEGETASTTTIDNMSVIEISQQHLGEFQGDVTREIEGLIYEQMTNAWINGIGAAPSGLLTGIAKFVRLKAGLPPDNQFEPDEFVTSTKGPWDVGSYATAHFLVYLEDSFQSDFVALINRKMADGWDESFTWQILGLSVEKLWHEWSMAPHPSPVDSFVIGGVLSSAVVANVSSICLLVLFNLELSDR
ncbi:hypothetical protein SELMODRAFT_97026 [Selaginella moellendorffii]|uniref:Uncharacterized protein n=2 Tax=Selaginella moellendorffii TaxID=88036 RepID=D8RNE4_SELML|nr:hypothetical protein SELMODRAFT_97026 [Selaginella moellendorffii]